MKLEIKILGIIATLCFYSCKPGPKVISLPSSATESGNTVSTTGIFSDDKNVNLPTSNASVPTSGDVHTVKVLEVLPTDKYIYLRVSEEDDEFWVATGKKEVEVGETYFYKNGILKTNFESKEYNRVFDEVYLVSNIVPANHGGNETSSKASQISVDAKTSTSSVVQVEGSIKISEIVANPEKYKGKSVQVSGVCTKLNANIMGRNWIHLKDGSKDDFDFVITSEAAVPEGHQVTMTGEVVLDKDFGAGYRYAIIMENGQMVNSKQ